MKFPRTSVIVATLTGSTAGALLWAQAAFHWSELQTVSVSACGAASVALLGFIAEHVRKETPSRWVGILGLIPAEVTTVIGMGIAFAWWGVSATKVGGAIVGGVAVVASLLGVTIAQRKVTSPETMRSEVAVAQASGRRGGEGNGIPPEAGQSVVTVLLIVVLLVALFVLLGFIPR